MSSRRQRFFQFIQETPTALHTVAVMSQRLLANGFQVLPHPMPSKPKAGKYLTVRDGSLLAMHLNDADLTRGITVLGAHSDSPAFKLKPNILKQDNSMVGLLTEVYGGPILRSWLDRPLSVAGSIYWEDTSGNIHNDLIDTQQPIAVIPSPAIHLVPQRDAGALNPQSETQPLVHCALDSKPLSPEQFLRNMLPKASRQQAQTVLAHELFLYVPEPATLIGGRTGTIYTAPRLDNRLSCFCLLETLLEAEPNKGLLVVVNDHEEIGSLTETGARGPLLNRFLQRLAGEDAEQMLNHSAVISVDNAHAVHPNFSDKHDPYHRPILNGGPVIKYSASRRYSSEGYLTALFSKACKDSGVPLQHYVNRNDIPGGSTIGPMTAAALGCHTLDIGLPTLGMHAAVETAGTADIDYTVRALTRFVAGNTR